MHRGLWWATVRAATKSQAQANTQHHNTRYSAHTMFRLYIYLQLTIKEALML